MRRFLLKFLKWSAFGLIALFVASLAAVPFVYPPIGAALCPACHGMERIQTRVIVDAGMPPATREKLIQNIGSGTSVVRAFYGSLGREPFVVACSTEACDRDMGGRGARADTLSTPFATVLRVSPRGIDPTIMAHEMSHVELHRRVGIWTFLAGAVPAWFDEGVAVVVSNDTRYLKDGQTADQRCMRTTDRELPSSGQAWGIMAGKDRTIYADAACDVLRWMERNGGRDGLLRTIDQVAAGGAVEN
jgi:hypothetical protein